MCADNVIIKDVLSVIFILSSTGLQFSQGFPANPTPRVYPHEASGPVFEAWSGGAVAPALAVVLTAIGVLFGCTWCYRHKDCKLFTASVTHLHEARRSQPPDSGFSEPVNNNISEDNNNGPISLREMQNIANNNAAVYITSENEERNRVSRESVVEFEPLPSDIRVIDPLEMVDWFGNASTHTDSSASYPKPCNISDEVTDLPTAHNSTYTITKDNNHPVQKEVPSSKEITMSADSLNASPLKKLEELQSPIDDKTYTKTKSEAAGTTPSVITKSDLYDSTKNTMKDLAYGTLMSGLPTYSHCTTELASGVDDSWKFQEPELVLRSPIGDEDKFTPPKGIVNQKICDNENVSPQLNSEPRFRKMESVEITCQKYNSVDENIYDISEGQWLNEENDNEKSPNIHFRNMAHSATSTPFTVIVEDTDNVKSIALRLPDEISCKFRVCCE